MLWTKKYHPKRLADIVGQAASITELQSFVQTFKAQRKKALLLYGPSGTGKTAAVYGLAYDLNLEVLEINASDLRDKGQIESIVGNAMKQRSLFSTGKLILVDEIDGLAGSEDRGGIAALAKIISETTIPIILTTTNAFDLKVRSLRSRSKLVQFMAVDHNDIFLMLKVIAQSEHLVYRDTELKKLSRTCGGDLRAAIIDLQILSIVDGQIHSEDIDVLSSRNKIEGMIQALIKIFKTTDPDIASSAYNSVDEDIDSIILWIEENIPLEYKNPKDLAAAYEMLSKADLYRARIRKRQEWRYLVYINSFLSVGVASSKDERYKGVTMYKPSSKLLKIWMANQRYAKRKSIAAKIGEMTHCSLKEAIRSTIPLIRPIFRNNKASLPIIEELKLDNEELEWLRKA